MSFEFRDGIYIVPIGDPYELLFDKYGHWSIIDVSDSKFTSTNNI